ncbi:hypothetical protein [Serinibacter arcticus]|uniref:Uncharacterized protein n=1 Tax=Serinibacter arcticus TaxID=1655435 RepID=A0A4Z1E542_9MICO|nr:hypothetical protein [Serinibacter arcticus]TGO05583.1 hypothetical protein SERN_1587 [Serinibacter arcticus]
MRQRPADEFSDPSADDDGAPGSASAAFGRSDRRNEPDAWTEELDGADPDDTDPDPASTPSPRRRRRRLLLATGGLAVLIAATGILLHAQERERRTPEAAVLDYVQLIESGDVEAATDLVPVLGYPADPELEESAAPTIDDTDRRPPVVPLERLENPALLTNAFYADNPGITDVTVERAEDQTDDPGVGESVEVAVSYSVDDGAANAVLRVEREPDSILGLPVWRVEDALTVPLVVTLPDGGLGSAYVGGTRVAVSGERGVPLYSSMVYPGVYTVSFDGGSYLAAGDVERRIASPPPGVDPATAYIAASLSVVPTSAANDAILQEVMSFLGRCGTTAQGLDLCPEPYRSGRATGDVATVSLSEGPSTFGVYSYWTGDETVQMISGSMEGSVTFPGEDGPVTEPFSLMYDFAIDDVEPRAQIRSYEPDL